jgi:nucleoside-diphosphate-sugar epimerase
MLHAAAQGQPYACFVREDTRIPFLTMPEAVEATLALARAPEASLRRCVYNVSGFSPSAGELAETVRAYFPEARISFEPDEARQAIVDSWPEDVDDSAARADWRWTPTHDLESAFEGYLVPRIRARYAGGGE